ncbi:hypothetical protein Q9247_09725 [Halomonas meridiana]|uniref:coiled-coil domain-containing protein n=1 Tax=Vreelandella aquamarina TaxID=77097 RepID=UPI00273A809D|nr:hypothetical protein [Halomonas meridiana]MDP4557961.1 hypothetical protein [Halomonas meridiana]
MGKARILEAWGEGRYTIEIIESRERAEFAKEQAQARVARLEDEIARLNNQIYQAQLAVDSAAAEQNAAIEQYRQDMADSGESNVELPALSEALIRAAGQRDALRSERRAKEIMVASDEALIARVNRLPALRRVQAWCADYTEDLVGEVATAEVPGEIGAVIIKPGFEGGEDSSLQGNAWSAETDGAIQPALSGTPAGVFYNLAMLPGWQKWRPTYRVATITALEGDTCTIVLESATSSQQRLPVNARSQYEDVPILYMDCNGAAFEEGDRVLVAFAGNVEGPTVVGFEEEPRSCGVSFDLQHFANWVDYSYVFRTVNNGFDNPNFDAGVHENWLNLDDSIAWVENAPPGTLALYFTSTKDILATKVRLYSLSPSVMMTMAFYECDQNRVPLSLVCSVEKRTPVAYVDAELEEPVLFKRDTVYMVAAISTYRYYPSNSGIRPACVPYAHFFASRFTERHPHIDILLPPGGALYGYSGVWRRSAVTSVIGQLPDTTYKQPFSTAGYPPGVDGADDLVNILPFAINPKGDPLANESYG